MFWSIYTSWCLMKHASTAIFSRQICLCAFFTALFKWFNTVLNYLYSANSTWCNLTPCIASIAQGSHIRPFVNLFSSMLCYISTVICSIVLEVQTCMKRDLGESMLNIITHITNISNARRFGAIQRELCGDKKIWFAYILRWRK